MWLHCQLCAASLCMHAAACTCSLMLPAAGCLAQEGGIGRYCPQLLADYLLLAAAPPSAKSRALLHYSSPAAHGAAGDGSSVAAAAAAAAAAEEDVLAGEPLSPEVAAALRRGAYALYGACSPAEVRRTGMKGSAADSSGLCLLTPPTCCAVAPSIPAPCAGPVPVCFPGRRRRPARRQRGGGQLAQRAGRPQGRLREAPQVHGQGVRWAPEVDASPSAAQRQLVGESGRGSGGAAGLGVAQFSRCCVSCNHSAMSSGQALKRRCGVAGSPGRCRRYRRHHRQRVAASDCMNQHGACVSALRLPSCVVSDRGKAQGVAGGEGEVRVQQPRGARSSKQIAAAAEGEGWQCIPAAHHMPRPPAPGHAPLPVARLQAGSGTMRAWQTLLVLLATAGLCAGAAAAARRCRSPLPPPAPPRPGSHHLPPASPCLLQLCHRRRPPPAA